jgi:hypothetical protein
MKIKAGILLSSWNAAGEKLKWVRGAIPEA